jgi:hypothetical protein
MSETSWDDVGKRFADLGRRLEETWKECRDDESARADLKDATDKVKVALDDVAETIDRAINSDDVRDATRSATAGVADALAATLQQVASWIEGAAPRKDESPGGTTGGEA